MSEDEDNSELRGRNVSGEDFSQTDTVEVDPPEAESEDDDIDDFFSEDFEIDELNNTEGVDGLQEPEEGEVQLPGSVGGGFDAGDMMGDMGNIQQRMSEEELRNEYEDAKDIDFEKQWVDENAVLVPGILYVYGSIPAIEPVGQVFPEESDREAVYYMGLVSERSFISDTEGMVTLVVDGNAYCVNTDNVLGIRYSDFEAIGEKKSEAMKAHIESMYEELFGEDMFPEDKS